MGRKAALFRYEQKRRERQLAVGLLCDLPAFEKRCQKCGQTKPAADFAVRRETRDGLMGTCRACCSIRSQAWTLRNRKKSLAIKKEWKLRNPEYQRARARIDKARYYARHGHKLREATRAWYAANKDKVLARIRSERGRMLRRFNQQNRMARQAAAENTLTIAEWEKILAAYGFACAYCRKPWTKHEDHLDHVVPLSKGGGFTRRNIVPSCGFCNGSKNARSHADWCAERGLDPEATLTPLRSIVWDASEVAQPSALRLRPGRKPKQTTT